MQRGSSKRRVAPKRTVNFKAAAAGSSPSGIKLDAQGKVIADQDPVKKFPVLVPEFNFVEEYQRNIEDAAQRVRSAEASHSTEPSRLIDNMKTTPLQNLKGFVESMLGLWDFNEEAEGPDTAFFKDCCSAIDADLARLKQTYKSLSKGNTITPSNLSDPFDAISDAQGTSRGSQSTSSLPSKVSTFNQLPPPIRTLTCTLRDLEQQRRQRVIVSKGLDYLRKKKPLADLQVEVGHQISKISKEDHWDEKDLNFHTNSGIVDIARMTLSSPMSGSSTPPQGGVKKISLKHSLISLYQFLMAQKFPDGLRSSQFKSHVDHYNKSGSVVDYGRFNQGFMWTIEDSSILKSIDKYKDLVKLQVLASPAAATAAATTAAAGENSGDLFLANVSNSLGLSFGYNYRATLALKEFHMILKAFGKSRDLEYAEDLAIKPRSRALKANIAKKLQEKSVGSVQVTQTGTNEIVDSDDDLGESDQKKKEHQALKEFLTLGSQLRDHGLTTAFGPEHVSVRLGGEYGRLRNAFDINRPKNPILESLPTPPQSQDDLPMIYESSEDENIPFADLQRKYRKRYRLLADPLRDSGGGGSRSGGGGGSPTSDDDDDLTTTAPSEEWPGTALSGYKQRVRDQLIKQESPHKRKKIQPPSQWRGQTYTLNADGEKVVVEEGWKTLSIKPRVRMFESRYDRGGDRALGFSVKGYDLAGREKQIIGIDETELHRRFALNKLWQVKMKGRDHLLANRRYFALVLDEEAGTARVVDAHMTKLIHSASPNQLLQDFNWELYWRAAREGKIQNRNEARKLRYDRLKGNNFVIWKDGLEKYQKLRERVSELQTHECPRDMKLKLMTQTPTIALNEIPIPPSARKALYENPTPLQGFVDHNTKEIEFKRKVALRTRHLLQNSSKRATREFRTLYKEARRAIAERNLYEQAWISNKSKRSTEATLAAAAAASME